MINQDKWIASLPKMNNNSNIAVDQLDHNKWVNTISKKKAHNSFKKYTLITILFVSGLLLVSALKNETRNLQKEIYNLEAAINKIRFNLNQANLDHEVITSPNNISILAKEHLNIDLLSYKKSQIKNLNNSHKILTSENKTSNNKFIKKINKSLSQSIKTQVAKKIQRKKTEIKKIQELYSNPKSIPSEVKTQATKQIKKKKNKLKNIYNSPREAFTLESFRKWGVVQVVKVFLGIPVVPGR